MDYEKANSEIALFQFSFLLHWNMGFLEHYLNFLSFNTSNKQIIIFILFIGLENL